MKKIRLLFMIPTLAHGGAEKVLVNLVNNLNKERFDVTVLALFDGGVNKQFLKPWIKFKACMPHTFRGNIHVLKLFSPERLYKFFIPKECEFDILISYLEGATARIISGCNNANVKLISWIHVEQHTRKAASLSFRSEKEAGRCYSKFHNTICVAKTVKEDFFRIFPEISSCEVLYNTVESDQIISMSNEAATEMIDDKKIRLIAVGTLKEMKAFDRLLRITKRLINEKYKVHLYILGRGPLENQFRSFIEENNLSDSITLLGYQTNPYKYMAKSDIFICSSHREGFSTATTEALILGVPVCTVEVSGMKEMLGNNNEYGIITENNEEALYQGIRQLLDNPDLLVYYQKRAAMRGKYFNTKQTVAAVEEMLEGMLKNNEYNITSVCFWGP